MAYKTCLLIAAVVLAQTGAAALTNRYVVKNNAGALPPYDSEAKAAPDIQKAIDYARAGETVLVYAATYDSGGITNWPAGGLLTNRVAITNAIVVRSLNNDPTNTIIKGAWASSGQTNGADAVRCVYMAAGAALIGFTVTNGATLTVNAALDRDGGGIYSASTATTISNCVITGCAAFGDVPGSGRTGGGAKYGTLYNCMLKNNSTPFRGGGMAESILSNCTVVGNSAKQGGGAYYGTLYGCVISSNSAATEGGGACYSMLYDCTVLTNTATDGSGAFGNGSTIVSNCTLAFNSARSTGGGVNACIVYNSTIVSNYATTHSGGAAGCTLFNSVISYNRALDYSAAWVPQMNNCIIAYNTGGNTALGNPRATNCLVYGNTAWHGGAVYGGFRLDNCTIVGNYASTGGGLAAEGAGVTSYANNCIVYSNNATSNPEWYVAAGAFLVFSNSCTFPDQAGWSAGNITNNPRFIAFGAGYGTTHVPGNYRLQASSPCVNKGLNQNWMTNAVDLDGRTRIRYGAVDMGAYEVLYHGTIYGVR